MYVYMYVYADCLVHISNLHMQTQVYAKGECRFYTENTKDAENVKDTENTKGTENINNTEHTENQKHTEYTERETIYNKYECCTYITCVYVYM